MWAALGCGARGSAGSGPEVELSFESEVNSVNGELSYEGPEGPRHSYVKRMTSSTTGEVLLNQ